MPDESYEEAVEQLRRILSILDSVEFPEDRHEWDEVRDTVERIRRETDGLLAELDLEQ